MIRIRVGDKDYEEFIDGIYDDNKDIIYLAKKLGLMITFNKNATHKELNDFLSEEGLQKIDQCFIGNIDIKTIDYDQLSTYLETYYKHRYYKFYSYFKTVEDALESLKKYNSIEEFIDNFDKHTEDTSDDVIQFEYRR